VRAAIATRTGLAARARGGTESLCGPAQTGKQVIS
jgi:hypothetical protein